MVLARQDAERYHRPPAALPRADRRRRQSARVHLYLRPPDVDDFRDGLEKLQAVAVV